MGIESKDGTQWGRDVERESQRERERERERAMCGDSSQLSSKKKSMCGATDCVCGGGGGGVSNSFVL